MGAQRQAKNVTGTSKFVLTRSLNKMGVDIIWSAEAWGMDGISTLAYLAAVTDRVQLGTGILQISARTPVMTAMTALSMAAISEDRFILGLGVSGPQVVEGLHGVSFANLFVAFGKPLTLFDRRLQAKRSFTKVTIIFCPYQEAKGRLYV